MKYLPITILFVLSFVCLIPAQDGQISVRRIEEMPRLPSPLHIRDWHKVAVKYDSLVFDRTAQGEYLPLVFTGPGVNYPEHDHFGLYSYVGAPNANAEAINVLPALVSATLNGIDKSRQNGTNWVLMAEDFFNRRQEEDVYLNNFNGQSGHDWWYDTMPNVFFYQLFDFYPQVGHFQQQFSTVADRWLQAVKAMGGSATPWHVPNFYHRAWALSTMSPNDDGVKEPEAAGAIGWILYMAYVQTGLDKYRIGAEWSLEFLNNFSANPFYELQLPYGVYVAARMNAELGTGYDLWKMLKWCFDPTDNVRGWGATVGNWGGYDCSGLIGEVNGDDYAFAMNTFEMLGALIPMVRYDERFARTIARWALNAINASRLFYANALPARNQDSEDWAEQYDPFGVISYEALREKNWYGDQAPFATGDALRNGWAATNLALYGASHAGILGAIVDTTDVPGILKLNVRATDYFSSDSLPMFLLYNPYDRDTSITVDVGEKTVRIYDMIGNKTLNDNALHFTSLLLKADQAVLICLIPADATLEWQRDRLLADSQVVDFHSGNYSGNYPPRIKALQAKSGVVYYGQTVDVYCTAEDPDGDTLMFKWLSEAGSLSGQGAHVQWTAPEQTGNYSITCVVSDGTEETQATVHISVTNNHAPQIEFLQTDSTETLPGKSVTLFCKATDADGDSLYYRWFTTRGDTFAGSARAFWVAPEQVGYYFVHCLVRDNKGAQAEDSVGITVGDLVLKLLLDGNAADSSTFGDNGQEFGTEPAADYRGIMGNALHFNGENDRLIVPNRPWLNFQNAVTVAFWMKVDTFFNREAYPLSHGNWENRWKISVTNRHLRWTIKTETGIYDLDTQRELQKNKFYYVSCLYDGQEMSIYLNGQIDTQKSCSGKILQTSYDLVLGQTLPNNVQYGFKGTLDNVFLYNRALSSDEVAALFQTQTPIFAAQPATLPKQLKLEQNYPNPFNPATVINYYLPKTLAVDLKVYNVQGALVKTLLSEKQASGWHRVQWNAQNVSSGLYFFRLQTRIGTVVKKGLKVK